MERALSRRGASEMAVALLELAVSIPKSPYHHHGATMVLLSTRSVYVITMSQAPNTSQAEWQFVGIKDK